MSTLRVIVCRVGQAPVVEEISTGLDPMQKIVGGSIERVAMDRQERGIDLWCNEEFLFGFEPNRLIRTTYGYQVGIRGDFFVSAHDGEGGSRTLTDAEVTEWMAKCNDFPMAISSMIPQGAN